MSSMKNYEAKQLGAGAPARAVTLGPGATRVLMVIFFSVLLLLYLAQSTQGATRQYDVRNLEDTLDSLQQNRAQLELDAVRLQALKAIAPVPTPPEHPTSPAPDPKTVPSIQSGDLVPADRVGVLPDTTND